MKQTQDVNVKEIKPLSPPEVIKQEIPINDAALETVIRGRDSVIDILEGRDDRLIAVVGPCSIHDKDIALDYAHRLNEVRKDVEDKICVIMRVYFEKPRTTVGWKGLINDPHLDGSCSIDEGVRLARQILITINEMGLPAGTEVLDPITPQYLSNLIAWSTIGARTTESQTHREMASGISMPVGFKNGTDGGLTIALNAMLSAHEPHSFLGIDQQGRICTVNTKGNPWGHLILRGGHSHTNYDNEHILTAVKALHDADLTQKILVDCSHANSGKKHQQQEAVWNDVLQQRLAGNTNIIGMMIESNISEGAQKIPEQKEDLKYGVSITDECMGWETTERILRNTHELLSNALAV